ncbi:MAG TPA: hypothetical protein VMC79_02865, partial [Rectinemataceae bacterium]|nr:hypothetical protein [Rectinemataceae bacterium]
WDRAEKAILAKKLSKPLAGPRACDFIEGLSKELGIEVYADCGAWPVDVAPPKNIEGMTVKQFKGVLDRKGISLVIGVSPINRRPSIPFDRLPGPGTKLPPGTPEEVWAIYLLKRP